MRRETGSVPGITGASRAFQHVTDLVSPLECAGCTRPRTAFCAACAEMFAAGPLAVRLRADVAVPVWSAGRYGGPAARALNAYKDAGRADLAVPFGRILADLLDALRARGELPEAGVGPLVLVPVPASRRARRSRGMDHVREIVAATAADLAGGEPASEVAIAPVLRHAGRARDSTRLTVAQREANVSGRFVRRDPGPFPATPGAPATLEALRDVPATVVVVDDVATTGATLGECGRVLARGGLPVSGAVTLLAA